MTVEEAIEHAILVSDEQYDKSYVSCKCAEEHQQLAEWIEEYLELKDEHEKLHELVDYMYRCFVRGHDWGPYCQGETQYVEDRMRELGIRVF